MVVTFSRLIPPVLVWAVLVCTWISAERCVYQTLQKTSQTTRCSHAVQMLLMEAWLLDKAETIRVNQWKNDTHTLLKNVENGVGDCVIYKMVPNERTGCCSGWTGENCDIVSCSPSCLYGRCLEPNVCTCDTGWTGRACDESLEAANDELRYCYTKENCAGDKIFNATTVAQMDCCYKGSHSWGTSNPNGSCVACNYANSTTPLVVHNKLVPFRTCVSGAHCAVRTFDGVVYEYCTDCTLNLVLVDDLTIASRTECDSHNASQCYSAVTVNHLSKARSYLMSRDYVSLVSANQSLPIKLVNFTDVTDHAVKIGDCSVSVVGDSFFLAFPQLGLKIRRDYHIQVFVTIGVDSPLRAGKNMRGACGNFDEDYTDEIMLANNKFEAELFGRSFTSEPCGPPMKECLTVSEIEAARQACSVLSSALFYECHRQIDVTPYVRLCELSYCSVPGDNLRLQEEIKCTAISAYSSACVVDNIVVHWRTQNLCGRTCGLNMVYKECGPSCKPTCGRALSSLLRDECQSCVPGCHCNDGYILFNNTCVPAAQCPCVHNTFVYTANDVIEIQDTCQKCTCGQFGHWNCSSSTDCYSSCLVHAPGVVTTFDGEEFLLTSHIASCNFTLVTLRSSLEIKLLAGKSKTTPDGITPQGFEIKVDNQHVRIEIGSTGGFDVLDVTLGRSAALPYLQGDIYVRQPTSSSVAADFNNFRVVFFEFGYLLISTMDSVFAGQLRGLCGNLNKLIEDDRLLLSGVQAGSDEIFAQAYSDDACGLTAKHQLDNQIAEVVKEGPDVRKLYEEFHQPVEAISTLNRLYLENRDVNILELAVLKLAISTGIPVSRILEHVGDQTDTLTSVNALMTCSGELQYRDNVKLCSTQCIDLLYNRKKCAPQTIQGCACSDGLLLTHDGQCLNETECPCYVVETKSFVRPGPVRGNICQSCFCEHGRVTCVDDGCEEIVCPRNQVVISQVSEAKGDNCTRYRCPDKYSNIMTCADSSLLKRKCVCKDGYIETFEGLCRPNGQCPCFYQDVWHIHGAEITEKCFLRQCDNGVWLMISRVECQASCYIAGSEMRIATFDGNTFNFPGYCSYTLMKTRGDGPGFKITVQNLACGVSGQACTHKIDIEFLGVHIQLVKGLGIVAGNKTYPFSDHLTIGEIQVVTTTLYTVVSFEEVAVFWTGGMLTWISVSNRWEGKLEGLCGTFDFNSKNDFLKSDNSLDSNPITFGLSWKEDDDTCSDEERVDPLQACERHPERRLWSRSQCSIIKTSETFHACRQVMPQSHIDRFLTDCETEACTCDKGGDCECLCDAIAHFEATCNTLGRPSKWRHQHLCPVQCENGMVYQPNRKPCHQTCKDVAVNGSTCDIDLEVEGCFCPHGYFLHDSHCIPQSECPCYHDGYEFKPGTAINQDCMNCTCTEGAFQCEGNNCTHCSKNEFRCETNGQCVPEDSVCNNFYDCYDGSDEKKEICASKNCSSQQFKCEDSGECIPLSALCDGIGHCADHSDEQLTNCTESCDFRCKGGHCIPHEYICDGYMDCPLGEDENKCLILSCDKDMFRCGKSLLCISNILICDGHDDCGDGFDELGCNIPIVSTVPVDIPTVSTVPVDIPTVSTVPVDIPTVSTVPVDIPTVSAASRITPTSTEYLNPSSDIIMESLESTDKFVRGILQTNLTLSLQIYNTLSEVFSDVSTFSTPFIDLQSVPSTSLNLPLTDPITDTNHQTDTLQDITSYNTNTFSFSHSTDDPFHTDTILEPSLPTEDSLEPSTTILSSGTYHLEVSIFPTSVETLGLKTEPITIETSASPQVLSSSNTFRPSILSTSYQDLTGTSLENGISSSLSSTSIGVVSNISSTIQSSTQQSSTELFPTPSSKIDQFAIKDLIYTPKTILVSIQVSRHLLNISEHTRLLDNQVTTMISNFVEPTKTITNTNQLQSSTSRFTDEPNTTPDTEPNLEQSPISPSVFTDAPNTTPNAEQSPTSPSKFTDEPKTTPNAEQSPTSPSRFTDEPNTTQNAEQSPTSSSRFTDEPNTTPNTEQSPTSSSRFTDEPNSTPNTEQSPTSPSRFTDEPNTTQNAEESPTSPSRFTDEPNTTPNTEQSPTSSSRFTNEPNTTPNAEQSPTSPSRFTDEPNTTPNTEQSPSRFTDEPNTTRNTEQSPTSPSRFTDEPNTTQNAEQSPTSPSRFTDEPNTTQNAEQSPTSPSRFTDEPNTTPNTEQSPTSPSRFTDEPNTTQNAEQSPTSPSRFTDEPNTTQNAEESSTSPSRFTDEPNTTPNTEQSPTSSSRFTDEPNTTPNAEQSPTSSSRFTDEPNTTPNTEQSPTSPSRFTDEPNTTPNTEQSPTSPSRFTDEPNTTQNAEQSPTSPSRFTDEPNTTPNTEQSPTSPSRFTGEPNTTQNAEQSPTSPSRFTDEPNTTPNTEQSPTSPSRFTDEPNTTPNTEQPPTSPSRFTDEPNTTPNTEQSPTSPSRFTDEPNTTPNTEQSPTSPSRFTDEPNTTQNAEQSPTSPSRFTDEPNTTPNTEQSPTSPSRFTDEPNTTQNAEQSPTSPSRFTDEPNTTQNAEQSPTSPSRFTDEPNTTPNTEQSPTSPSRFTDEPNTTPNTEQSPTSPSRFTDEPNTTQNAEQPPTSPSRFTDEPNTTPNTEQSPTSPSRFTNEPNTTQNAEQSPTSPSRFTDEPNTTQNTEQSPTSPSRFTNEPNTTQNTEQSPTSPSRFTDEPNTTPNTEQSSISPSSSTETSVETISKSVTHSNITKQLTSESTEPPKSTFSIAQSEVKNISQDYTLTTSATPTASTFETPPQQRTTNIELCTSQWSAWSDCQKTCSRVSVRTRLCFDHVKNCDCRNEVLHQGKTCLSTCSPTELPTQSLFTGTTQSATSSGVKQRATTNTRSSLSTTSSTPDTCLCEPSKTCTTCVQNCEKSCRIFRMNASCHQEDECHSGCECPDGQLMDDHGHCSPKERCPCYDSKGMERHYNCTYLDEVSCKICKCGEHGNVCQDQSTDLEVLYKFGQWSPWSDCSASCGNGTTSRYRIGQYRKCSIRLVETKECINNECSCLTKNLTVVNDGDTYRIDECQLCTCDKGNLNCTADPVIKDNALWQSWGPWSPCKQHCKLYYQSRCRACRSLCGQALCHGGQCETRACGPEPCCDVFKWSEWGDCTNRCGDFRGHRTRFRIYPFAATCPDVVETQPCEKCKCPDKDEESLTEWSEWTQCYAEGQTCGWGKRTRKRTSAIENPEIQTEECFLRQCECPQHLTWSNHSLCQRTCETEPSPECYLQLSGACVCPSHLVSDGNKCIPLQECSLTCTYEDKTYQVGETVPCGDCHVCQCGRAFVFKQKKVCQDLKQCNLTTHQLVPSQDSCCVVDCVAKETCKVHRLPPSYITIDNCRSLVKVQQEFCQGPCSASSQFVNYQTKQLEIKSCSCCVGTVSSFQKVDFKCNDSFLVTHQLPNLDCSCTACNIN